MDIDAKKPILYIIVANGLLSVVKWVGELRALSVCSKPEYWFLEASVEGVSGEPWRIPLRTALVRAPLSAVGD